MRIIARQRPTGEAIAVIERDVTSSIGDAGTIKEMVDIDWLTAEKAKLNTLIANLDAMITDARAVLPVHEE